MSFSQVRLIFNLGKKNGQGTAIVGRETSAGNQGLYHLKMPLTSEISWFIGSQYSSYKGLNKMNSE